MANFTEITPALDTSTQVATTTNDSETTTQTPQTTITSLKQDTTTTTLPANTTEHIDIKPTDAADDKSGNIGPIVGGCVGGVVGILLIIVIVLFIRRRNRRRNSGNVPVLPDKDFLDSIHVEHAVQYHREHQAQGQDDSATKPYANLTPLGDTDEQTDPAVGPDGYLKKTKNFFLGKPKHKKQKKSHHNVKKKTKAGVRTDADGIIDLPIYTNEIPNAKQLAGRTNSMPCNDAPPPPRDSSGYTTGRVAVSTEEKKNETSDGATSLEGYVNLQGHEKGKAVFGVAPKTGNRSDEQSNVERKKIGVNASQKSNIDQDKHSAKPDTRETEQKKLYENVTGGNYYNLKANKQQELQRQSTYEYVGTESEVTLQQDNVYENP